MLKKIVLSDDKKYTFFFICSYTQLQNSGKVHILMEWVVFRDHSYSNLNRRGRMKSDPASFDVRRRRSA